MTQQRNPSRRGFAARALCVLLLAGTASSAVAQTFTVGSARADRGEKATGYLEVAPGSDAGTTIPVAVVQGARPGPVLAVTAGSHGTEYASILAVVRLIDALDPADVSGTVVLVPLINRASFDHKVAHVNPIDGKNMNRFYPGRRDGTQTERVAYAVTHEIIEHCDHLIDLHGGDLDESLRPFAYWNKSGNEQQDRISREMVLAFGIDHIVVNTTRPKDKAASRYLENTATTRGKPSITAEAGHAGTAEPEDVERLFRGCLSVMRFLRMLPGEPAPVRNPVWIAGAVTVPSEHAGVFHAVVKRGSYVEKGMKVGYVTDFFGRTVHEALAPENGVVLYICAVPSMKKGDTIANIGLVSPPGR
jgi:predicted deacylase